MTEAWIIDVARTPRGVRATSMIHASVMLSLTSLISTVRLSGF